MEGAFLIPGKVALVLWVLEKRIPASFVISTWFEVSNKSLLTSTDVNFYHFRDSSFHCMCIKIFFILPSVNFTNDEMDPLQSLGETGWPLWPIFRLFPFPFQLLGRSTILDFFENIKHAKNHIDLILCAMFVYHFYLGNMAFENIATPHRNPISQDNLLLWKHIRR